MFEFRSITKYSNLFELLTISLFIHRSKVLVPVYLFFLHYFGKGFLFLNLVNSGPFFRLILTMLKDKNQPVVQDKWPSMRPTILKLLRQVGRETVGQD